MFEREDFPREPEADEPCYVISVVARILGTHAQTLRYYERVGIIVPSRSRGNVRLYSQRDVWRLQQVKRLMEDLGVNLAGAEIIINMRERIVEMEGRLKELEGELVRLRGASG